MARAVVGGVVQVDAFEALLLHAGLEGLSEVPPREADFTPEDAAQLYDALLRRPTALANFPPRRVAFHLLGQLLEGEEELPREALVERVRRYQFIAVLRPDGYLAWGLSGRTQQRLGQLKWQEGVLRLGRLEVGALLEGEPGMAFFPVDDSLKRTDWRPVVEVYDDADVISRTLDGAELALLETGLGLGEVLTRPVDSLAALSRLPEGVAALIASSPEYYERLMLMTRGEQIQAISKLTVSLVTTFGTAVGSTRTLASVGRGLKVASVPALTVSAEGVLAMRRVALPVGRLVTKLSGGPGAALILHRANEAGQGSSPKPALGPGQWAPARESMSRRAARYQEQICGRPADDAYWVGGTSSKEGGVRFDGFEEGVLLDAKGPGYANKFLDNLEPKRWFRNSGARDLILQARRQVAAANGVPIRWHVAEEKAAKAIRKLLDDAEVMGVEVVHTSVRR